MQNNLLVDIYNEALVESGMDTTITSLDENSNLADLANRIIDPTIQELYSEHPWAFKVVRTTADMQTAGSPNQYAYPSNCLRILGFYLDQSYEVRDKDARVSSDTNGVRVIYSPKLPLYLEYIRSLSDNDSMPIWVKRCLVLKLAIKIQTAKGKDNTRTIQLYQAESSKARENNANESLATIIDDESYINVRG